jgi:hypothetical protein
MPTDKTRWLLLWQCPIRLIKPALAYSWCAVRPSGDQGLEPLGLLCASDSKEKAPAESWGAVKVPD